MMAVPRLAQRCVISRGTLHSSRMKAPHGSKWTVARRLEGGVRLALATSCAEACSESAASPVRLHRKMNGEQGYASIRVTQKMNGGKAERSVTISFQAHLQLASALPLQKNVLGVHTAHVEHCNVNFAP